MPPVVRPRRSMLFMPGSNTRAMAKATILPADGLIFDLEDAVAPVAKETARQQICETVRAGDYGQRELVVRMNALTTPWGRDDLIAVARSGADALLVPKVESGDMARQIAELMAEHGAPETMALWCMLETPRGILRAEEIATAHTRLEMARPMVHLAAYAFANQLDRLLARR